MITLASSRTFMAPSRLSVALRGALLVTGATLLLAGCGSNQHATSSAPPGSAKPAASKVAKASAPTSAAAPAHVPAPATSAAKVQAQAAAAKAKLASMSVSDLLSAARKAYAQHRIVAPAGDNAMEYYEAVLAKDPKNQVARDALRETFPFGVPDVEKVIAHNNFGEADREIDVLAKADPTNYTLTLLRSKLDAQKKLQARQQQEALQKTQKAAELAAAKQAAAAKAAQDAAAQARAASEAAAAAKTAAVQPRQQRAEAVPPPAPKPVGETHGAKVVKMAAAQYPIAAARNQTSGYATVEFTVTATGAVSNVHVVDSSPRRVFDQAAIQAIKNSKFEPALKDGQPVSAVLQRKVAFKFGG